MTLRHPGKVEGSRLDRPVTRDFADGVLARLAIVEITKDDGSPIGS